MPDGSPQDEYTQASENIRHFQTTRFTLLTVFIAISAGLLTVLSSAQSTSPGHLPLILKIAGLATTLLFWLLQERTMLYWYHFVHRAAELESVLGYKLYSVRPNAGIFTSNIAIRLFFLVIALFWIATMISGR
jgi:hypothetical protein